MQIRPLRDRILIRREDAESVTKGGIILPDGSKTERPQKGTVLAVGPGRLLISPLGQPMREPMSCEVGDEVIFTKYSGDGYKFGGEELFLIKEEDLVAVCEPDEPEPAEDPYTTDELIEEFEEADGGAFILTDGGFPVAVDCRSEPPSEAMQIEAAHAATVGYLSEPAGEWDPDQHVAYSTGPLAVFRPDREPEHLSAGR